MPDHRHVTARAASVFALAALAAIPLAMWFLGLGAAPIHHTPTIPDNQAVAPGSANPSLHSTPPSDRRTLLVPARATVRVKSEDGRPVAATVKLMSKGQTPSDLLGTCAADGHGEFDIPHQVDWVSIGAAGHLSERVQIARGNNENVTLRRAHSLTIACQDLLGNPVPGVRIAIAPTQLPDAWIDSGEARLAGLAEDNTGRWVGQSDISGNMMFVALPACKPNWQVRAPHHALVSGPSIGNETPLEVPGTHTFRFAPLIASGLVVEGDRLVSIANLRMPGDGLIPIDRSGTAQKAAQDLRTKFPGLVSLEVMATREPDKCTGYEMDIVLERTGMRTVAIKWRTLADFLENGPDRLAVDATAAAPGRSFVGRAIVRLMNPDGSTISGCKLLFLGDSGSFFATTGTELEAPVGKFRVRSMAGSIASSIVAPIDIEVRPDETSELTVQLNRALYWVRFLRPKAAENLVGCHVVIENEAGRQMAVSMDGRKTKHVDVVLPAKRLNAYASYFGSPRTKVPFDVAIPRSGQSTPQVIQLPD